MQTFRSLLGVIKDDVDTNIGWGRPGARAMAVYRLGAWLLERPASRSGKILLRLHRFLEIYIRNSYGIEIYRTSSIGRRVMFAHQNAVVIHAFAKIGDDCVIRQGVTMGVARSRDLTPSPDNGPTVGNRVDIGVGAVIVGSVKIGDDVRIFPNAVVLTDVPSGSTVMTPSSRILTMASPTPPNPPEDLASSTT